MADGVHYKYFTINYFETSSTAILQNTKFLIILWVFVDDDNGDNEMIM